MFDLISTSHFVRLFGVVSFFISILFGVFLYWRAGRHELLENQVLFDVVAIFGLGSFVGGRLIDFATRPDFYSWSLTKLIFFNAFWGFDVYGAFLGGVIFVWLYLRKKKEKFWEVFDFAAEGLAFGLSIYIFLTFVSSFAQSRELVWILVVRSFCYLLLFWAIKRLSKQKKHVGYFASLFLVFASFFSLVFGGLRLGDIKWSVLWPELFLAAFVIVASVNWYLLARRKVSDDVKNSLGLMLLSIFKIKRVATNIREADNSAKAIVLSPYYLVKGVWFLVKYILKEIVLSFVDMKRSFGFGK